MAQVFEDSRLCPQSPHTHPQKLTCLCAGTFFMGCVSTGQPVEGSEHSFWRRPASPGSPTAHLSNAVPRGMAEAGASILGGA